MALTDTIISMVMDLEGIGTVAVHSMARGRFTVAVPTMVEEPTMAAAVAHFTGPWAATDK